MGYGGMARRLQLHRGLPAQGTGMPGIPDFTTTTATIIITALYAFTGLPLTESEGAAGIPAERLDIPGQQTATLQKTSTSCSKKESAQWQKVELAKCCIVHILRQSAKSGSNTCWWFLLNASVHSVFHSLFKTELAMFHITDV